MTFDREQVKGVAGKALRKLIPASPLRRRASPRLHSTDVIARSFGGGYVVGATTTGVVIGIPLAIVEVVVAVGEVLLLAAVGTAAIAGAAVGGTAGGLVGGGLGLLAGRPAEGATAGAIAGAGGGGGIVGFALGVPWYITTLVAGGVFAIANTLAGGAAICAGGACGAAAATVAGIGAGFGRVLRAIAGDGSRPGRDLGPRSYQRPGPRPAAHDLTGRAMQVRTPSPAAPAPQMKGRPEMGGLGK
jgi:hypothetical protein